MYGTYLQGLFDSDTFRTGLRRFLYQKKGMQPADQYSFLWQSYREQQYDKLADAVRQHLNLPFIYQILEEGL